MSYIWGEDCSQAALLPAAIEDHVAADAPIRVIDAFVNGLDARRLGFGRSVPPATGRPPYDPRDFLKLYLYGYLNEVRSSRRLERECSRNLEVKWLLRRLAPDFKMPAQPVDATLYPRWKDGVYSVISEESQLSVSSQAHLNKWCVSSTNGHVKPWELKSQQKDLMQVLRRPFETTKRLRPFAATTVQRLSGHAGRLCCFAGIRDC
jgi:hypothetical protein